MANKRISELPVAGEIIGDEALPIMQSGETRKTTINSVLADIESRKVGFVDLASGALSPSFNTIKLSSNPTLGTISVGEFYYDVAEQTATLNLGTTNLQVGQELYVRVRNNTGSTIPNGSVVYINGASGTRPTIALARANSINTATTVIGVTTEEIASGALGSVTISGIVNELNTSAYVEGTLLYLSSSTAGAFVQTTPNYPNLLIEVGRVVRQHATQGQILVKVAVNNASYLKGELGNSETAVVGSGLVGYNSSRAYSAGTVGAELNNHGSVIATLTNGIATKIGKTASTGSAEIPVGTTAQRDGAAQQGYFRFNSTLNQFEGYNGTAWGAVGAGATGGVGNAVFYENDTNVTQNYTITTGKNAMSAGPITINDGVTVTVPNGSVWSVI